MPLQLKFPQKFKQKILHGYCVRFHMALIVSAVVASGVLASKTLLVCGMTSLRFRYALAVLGSYAVFLLLVRVWIWYVAVRHAAAANLGVLDPGGVQVQLPVGPSGASVQFGGGDSGGGGASDTWSAGEASEPAPSSGGGLLSGLDIDLGDDGWLVLLLLLALVLAIFAAGGYLVYAAPQILPEAAWQGVLASALLRVPKEHHHGWMPGVLRATALPFGVILVLAEALSWAAHHHCPDAARLADVVYCVAR